MPNCIPLGTASTLQVKEEFWDQVLKTFTEFSRIMQGKTEHPPSQEIAVPTPQKPLHSPLRGVVSGKECLPDRRDIEAVIRQQVMRKSPFGVPDRLSPVAVIGLTHGVAFLQCSWTTFPAQAHFKMGMISF